MIKFQDSFNDFTVLIAEDDEVIRTRMVNTLSFYFKSVLDANNGKKAYELFVSKKPSLLITDIKMDNGSGIKLVQKIRQIDKYTPIIILSAYSTEEYLLELINLRITQYLLKPTNSEHLFEAIGLALLPKICTLELPSDVTLDLENSQLNYLNKHISLRKKEKIFLELLHQNNHKITTYNMIQENVWGEKVMTQNALKTFVKELRKKIPISIIDNVIQEGYRLNYS